MFRSIFASFLVLLSATACRTVTGYSDFRAEIRDPELVRVKVLTPQGAIDPFPDGRDGKVEIPGAPGQKVTLRNERGLLYLESTSAYGGGRVVPYQIVRPVDVTLDQLDHIPSSTPITWADTRITDRTNYKSDANRTTWDEYSITFNLATDWSNVGRVTATQHGSDAKWWGGYGGALAFYLAGAFLVSRDLQALRDHQEVQPARLLGGIGLIGVGIPLFMLGRANGDEKFVVWGPGRGTEVVEQESSSSCGGCGCW